MGSRNEGKWAIAVNHDGIQNAFNLTFCLAHIGGYLHGRRRALKVRVNRIITRQQISKLPKSSDQTKIQLFADHCYSLTLSAERRNRNSVFAFYLASGVPVLWTAISGGDCRQGRRESITSVEKPTFSIFSVGKPTYPGLQCRACSIRQDHLRYSGCCH